MKRCAIVVLIVLGLLTFSGCSGIIDTRPPCAEVKVDKSKSVLNVDKAHDNKLVRMYAVKITYNDFGKAYAIGRDGALR